MIRPRLAQSSSVTEIPYPVISLMQRRRVDRSPIMRGDDLRGWDNGIQARQSLDAYFRYYNQQCRHQSLERPTPDQMHYENEPLPQAA